MDYLVPSGGLVNRSTSLARRIGLERYTKINTEARLESRATLI